MFNNTEYNEEGVYSVNLHVVGKHKQILVDDQFPTYNNKSLFTVPRTNELWVILLEKAWVKLFGSYLKAEKCMVHIVLEYLSGAPSVLYYKNQKDYWDQDSDSLRTLISTAYNNNYVLACSSTPN